MGAAKNKTKKIISGLMDKGRRRERAGAVGISRQKSSRLFCFFIKAQVMRCSFGRRGFQYCILARKSNNGILSLCGGPGEAQCFSVPLHCSNAEGDVVVERDAEFCRALGYIVAVDPFGEGFVLHLFSDACEFVAGEEGFVEMRDAGHSGVFGMAEDGGANLFGPALLGEDLVADEGMVFERRIFFVV